MKKRPAARAVPTHEPVGLPWDDFGKWVHYKQHTVGTFRFICGCGHDVNINVRIEKAYGARFTIKHRSASRQFTTVEPKAADVLARCEMVTKFKWCHLPWAEYF